MYVQEILTQNEECKKLHKCLDLDKTLKHFASENNASAKAVMEMSFLLFIGFAGDSKYKAVDFTLKRIDLKKDNRIVSGKKKGFFCNCHSNYCQKCRPRLFLEFQRFSDSEIFGGNKRHDRPVCRT